MAAGQVTLDGKTYTKRHQVIPAVVNVPDGNLINYTLTLPGIAQYLLRGLTREILTTSGAVITGLARFLYRLGNSDGSIWYSVGGIGGTTDLVIDSLMFGNGQFPYVLDPYIPYSMSASIKMQIQDLSGLYPYNIYFGMQGCWLLPS